MSAAKSSCHRLQRRQIIVGSTGQIEQDERYLDIGVMEHIGEIGVVINHLGVYTDERGAGYILFTVEQARNVARLLFESADEAEKIQACQ